MSLDTEKPTVDELKTGTRGRKLTKKEEDALARSFSNLRVYWGPDVALDGRGFRMAGPPRHWYRYKERGVDSIRGGTVRFFDTSGSSVSGDWRMGSQVWGSFVTRYFRNRGGETAISRALISLFSSNPDNYVELDQSEIPLPRVYVEDSEAGSNARRNLWFVVGGEVRDRYVVLRDGGDKRGDLGWIFRAPTHKIFFSDMAKVGKFLSQFTTASTPLGLLFNRFIDDPEKIASLSTLAGKLSKAEETIDNFLEGLDDEKLSEVGQILVDAGMDESIPPDRILKVALLLANVDL